jgi:hypothetical protein
VLPRSVDDITGGAGNNPSTPAACRPDSPGRPSSPCASVSPGGPHVRYRLRHRFDHLLELSEEGGGAHKFYEVRHDGTEVTITFGHIGEQGQVRSSSYPSTEKAAAAFGVFVGKEHAWVGNQNGDVYTLTHDGQVTGRFGLPDGVKCIVADDF